MTDIVVGGIDHHREWMLQVVSCDCVTGARREFIWFFNTREEAETCLERIASSKAVGNTIVKILKVRAFEHLGLDFKQNEKEN